MLLNNIACQDQEENIEVASLVISKLNKAVVGQQDVVLLVLEGRVTVTLRHRDRKFIHKFAALLNLVTENGLRWQEILEILL